MVQYRKPVKRSKDLIDLRNEAGGIKAFMVEQDKLRRAAKAEAERLAKELAEERRRRPGMRRR